MLSLPYGCRCSKFTAYPSNWQDRKTADLSLDWYFSYRFYDPSHPKPKQVTIRGMNTLKSYPERAAAMRMLIDVETDLLVNQGYNPITKKVNPPRPSAQVIDPEAPLCTALAQALERLKVQPTTKRDISGILKHIRTAAAKLSFNLPVKEIRRRHIKMILEQIEEARPRFTDNTFNHYRKYLAILFAELMELDVIELNPITGIKRRKLVKKEKDVLTSEQRVKLDNYLRENHPAFHRFTLIFFHSGARESELVRLQVKDVDLARQRYKTIVLKGARSREVYRTIKDIALPLWAELIEGADSDHYVFSRGLVPGPEMIQAYQITKRWYRIIRKEKRFGITAEFYSLKHLNTSEVVDHLDEQAAASLNGHTSTAMVRSIYDVKQADRQHDRIKKINNSFS